MLGKFGIGSIHGKAFSFSGSVYHSLGWCLGGGAPRGHSKHVLQAKLKQGGLEGFLVVKGMAGTWNEELYENSSVCVIHRAMFHRGVCMFSVFLVS